MEQVAVKGKDQPIELLVGQDGPQLVPVEQDLEREEEKFGLLFEAAVGKMAVDVPDAPAFAGLALQKLPEIPFRLGSAVQQDHIFTFVHFKSSTMA